MMYGIMLCACAFKQDAGAKSTADVDSGSSPEMGTVPAAAYADGNNHERGIKNAA